MNRGRIRAAWIRFLLVVFAIVFAVGGCFEERTSGPDGAISVAPAFDLPRLNGSQIQLAELRGKIVILDFWATWCKPCEVQMPVLDTLWRDEAERAAHGDDLMIIGISVDTDPVHDVAKWIAEKGFEYPIAIGDQDLAMRYGVIGYPTLVLIDPTGGIHTRHIGVLSRPEIDSILDEIRRDTPGPS